MRIPQIDYEYRAQASAGKGLNVFSIVKTKWLYERLDMYWSL